MRSPTRWKINASTIPSTAMPTPRLLHHAAGFLDDQISLVIHTQPRLPCLLQHRGIPVDLACVGTTDDRHQERVGCVGETPETSVDTDRNVDHVSFIKIDRALLLAIQPENLPSTLHW